MNTPAPQTSPDAALGNLMAAALDVPPTAEPPEVPAWAPDNTLARTGNTADHQAGWFAGMEQGQTNAQENTANRAAAGWLPIESAPKTGRTLLLGYWNSHGKWRTVRGQWISAEYIAEHWEEPDDAEEGWFETAVEAEEAPNCWRITPSHWQPLPAAPGVSTEGDAPAAYLTLDEEGSPCMLFFDVAEARGYCALGEEPEALYRRPTPAAGDALDAARYRWLCDKFGITKLPCAIERIIEGSYVPDGKAAIDAAIDTAIAAQQGKGGAR